MLRHVSPALLALLLSSSAAAQPAIARPPPPATPPVEVVEPDSPRASMADFLALAHKGRYAEASRYLEVAPGEDAATATRHLTAVLDRMAWIDLDQLSPKSDGKQNDNLPADLDEVARLTVDGMTRSVRIARRQKPDGVRWVFTRATVDQVDRWYDALGDRWMREHLPDALLRPGPRGLMWWQWLALPLLVLFAFGLGRLVAWVAGGVLHQLVRRTRATWDDVLLERVRGPLWFASALLVVRLLVPLLDLNVPAEEFIGHCMRAGVLVVVFWTLLRSIDLVAELIRTSPWGRTHPSSLSMVPLGVQVSRVGLFAMAAIAVLSELGYPVASLLAGLGIGGLALALAAQKTVENLFGSVSISVDQPFRVGDFVKVEDVMGTVEFVGLRSTRIRTLDRTLITWPNGKLADMRTENYGARDRIRFFTTLGLVYGTTSAQMRSVLSGIEGLLKNHPDVDATSVVVTFSKLGDSALVLEILAYFKLNDWNRFVGLRQDVLLSILEIVERSGTSAAFPTTTVELKQVAAKAR